MEPESIAVAPSADNGNVPIDAPSEPAAPATPTEPTEPAKPAEPAVELFDLPDGRKVDASTLSKEWKENFYPDYTRKSQELASKNKPPETLPNTEPAKNPLADPDYVPQTYEELALQIEARTLEKFEAKERAKVEQREAVENAVATQLAEIKTTDPNLNENALFQHATKYGFRDLKLAHQNMKDMSETMKKVAKTTADNITKRNDPVSISPGATGNRPDASQFSSARDFLRSLNK